MSRLYHILTMWVFVVAAGDWHIVTVAGSHHSFLLRALLQRGKIICSASEIGLEKNSASENALIIMCGIPFLHSGTSIQDRKQWSHWNWNTTNIHVTIVERNWATTNRPFSPPKHSRDQFGNLQVRASCLQLGQTQQNLEEGNRIHCNFGTSKVARKKNVERICGKA